MATHSSILAWRIPWTEKPGGLQSMGSQRVGHDWSDLAHSTVIHTSLHRYMYLKCIQMGYNTGTALHLTLWLINISWSLHISTYKSIWSIIMDILGFPGSSDGKESACNAGDPDSISGSGRSSGEKNGNPLQYSSLENSMDRGAWLATVCRVTKNQTRLSK